ncbi:hypothetical protein AB0F25_37335 [Streptomyces wedmorensis]|uniref:hypothetical protein n=1 Tax=Streptomyces wedmorensis TaxID=43759 RepID=UPI003423FD32
MSETEPLWAFNEFMLVEDLKELLRDVGPGLAPDTLHPALASFHNPADPSTGVLSLVAQILRTIGSTVGEQTPHHEAVRKALDEAAAHITETAGRHIAAALDLLTPPDGR